MLNNNNNQTLQEDIQSNLIQLHKEQKQIQSNIFITLILAVLIPSFLFFIKDSENIKEIKNIIPITSVILSLLFLAIIYEKYKKYITIKQEINYLNQQYTHTQKNYSQPPHK